ncbi:unnamed protein product [Schistocephalus solidus]|uniref:Uncharacterized protein n=1 Tax=Schistocephalus solidus TaxID=70667 RepID=A0A183T7A4_SCHSO|nr:unnamed protein product [Schistocephalus solidus]
MPVPRPRVHPRGLLPRRIAKEGVGQQETVFRTRAQKKKAVFVTATATERPSASCQAACSVPTRALKSTRTIGLYSFVKVASRSLQVLLEFVLRRIIPRH